MIPNKAAGRPRNGYAGFASTAVRLPACLSACLPRIYNNNVSQASQLCCSVGRSVGRSFVRSSPTVRLARVVMEFLIPP